MTTMTMMMLYADWMQGVGSQRGESDDGSQPVDSHSAVSDVVLCRRRDSQQSTQHDVDHPRTAGKTRSAIHHRSTTTL